MKKYKYLVGHFEPRRSCTVSANSIEDSKSKVKIEMDKRYEKRNECPPVGYDLELVSINGKDYLP